MEQLWSDVGRSVGVALLTFVGAVILTGYVVFAASAPAGGSILDAAVALSRAIRSPLALLVGLAAGVGVLIYVLTEVVDA